jgi:hypothetical protein
MKGLLLIVALMIPQMAMARIGETLEQCDKRYGDGVEAPSTKEGFEKRAYQKKPFLIIACYMNGKCETIEYATTEKSRLDVDTAKILVGMNLAKPKFMPNPDGSPTGLWSCEKKSGVAVLSVNIEEGKEWVSLGIMSSTYLRANEKHAERKKQEEVDKLGL